MILKAARAQAAFEGRTRITERDIALAAELALPHRVKSGPFRKSEVGLEALDERIEQLKSQTTVGEAQEEDDAQGDADETKKKALKED